MPNDEDWRKLLKQVIRESRRITKYKNSQQYNWSFEKAPNYNVYEISPSQKLDMGKSYRISGSEANIMLQSSLIKALHDILGNRLGYTVDFGRWFEDFSYEFKFDPVNNKFREGIVDNEDDQGQVEALTFWGVNKSERPKFKWVEPQDINEYDNETNTKFINETGYYVIKFWKNRSLEDKFIYIAGTLTDIRSQLINLMRQGAVSESGEKGYKSENLSFIGLPKVVLYFKELNSDVEPGYDALLTRMSFRIVNKTDNPNSSLEKITKSDVKNLATRIRDIFATKPTPYRIHRGKETVSVKDKARGYDGYVYVFNKNDGIDLFTKMYEVQNYTIDLKKVFHKTTIDEVNAYPTVPPDITILGKTVKASRIRPVGYVQFYEAKLFLSRLDTPIKLCDALGYVYSDLG